ncbi:hypothetical protein [Halosolutus gelatinilyticus]|uniref:hypothetical protein n=1 Tax=Halosolutus gelatinilyticus TaxID=2931975 RepID=UPI001FF3105D|nr:hypothetical protein [Halosolutus gelatinilyticus]
MSEAGITLTIHDCARFEIDPGPVEVTDLEVAITYFERGGREVTDTFWPLSDEHYIYSLDDEFAAPCYLFGGGVVQPSTSPTIEWVTAWRDDHPVAHFDFPVESWDCASLRQQAVDQWVWENICGEDGPPE